MLKCECGLESASLQPTLSNVPDSCFPNVCTLCASPWPDPPPGVSGLWLYALELLALTLNIQLGSVLGEALQADLVPDE